MLKGGAPGRNFGSRVLAGAFALTLAAGYGLMQARVADASSFCSSNTINAVWVTITEIDAHIAKQKGFQTLATGGPTQINLLAPNDGTSPGSCMLGALGDIDGLPPGKYGQVRIILANNGGSHGNKPGAPNLNSNACQTPGGLAHDVVNCVEFTPNGGSPTFAPLDVGSASNTGLKVPPGQVGQGGLTVTQGELLDLLVTMDPCTGLVATGFGKGKGKGNSAKKFKLKPTLHRGELSLVPFIAGTVVDGSLNTMTNAVALTSSPVSGANVWLEMGNSPFTKFNGTAGSELVNDVVATTFSNSNGTFEFCPIAAGTYEAVADASTVGGHGSDATISTGITVTGTAGPNDVTIPLVAAASSGFNAEFDSDGTTGISIAFGGAQFDTSPSANTLARVPFLDGSSPTSPSNSATTVASTAQCSCPVNCACATVDVPNDGPVIGSGNTYTLQTDNLAVHGTTAATCSNQALITDPGSAPPSNPTLGFTGCP